MTACSSLHKLTRISCLRSHQPGPILAALSGHNYTNMSPTRNKVNGNGNGLLTSPSSNSTRTRRTLMHNSRSFTNTTVKYGKIQNNDNNKYLVNHGGAPLSSMPSAPSFNDNATGRVNAMVPSSSSQTLHHNYKKVL